MEQRAIGSSGVSVPAIGMGTWNTFDVRSEREQADRTNIVDVAVAHGATLFDTSPMYGHSPLVLSRAIGTHRDNVLIADKIWTSSITEGRDQIHRSLALFGGKIDIYQIHNLVSWSQHLPDLEELKSKGKVQLIGATHYAHGAFRELMTVMRTGRIQVIQVPYNATDRVVEQEVLPLAAELGIGVLVMQPLDTGRLARHVPPASELEPLKKFGIDTWAQALLKWVLSDQRVHCVIPATSKLSRASENAAAGDGPWFDVATREHVSGLAARPFS